MVEDAQTDVVRIKIINSYYIEQIEEYVWYHGFVGQILNVVEFSETQWQVLGTDLQERNAFINKNDVVVLELENTDDGIQRI